MPNCICCTPKSLHRDMRPDAAIAAVNENPRNRPEPRLFPSSGANIAERNEAMVAATSKYWRVGGVRLSVGFLDDAPPVLRARLLAHMNEWSRTANVAFVETRDDPHVRITRGADDGHWSYVGTDLLLIARDRPTMNLAGFTMSTPDAEFYRVVRHQTGHVLGCTHERLPRNIVDRIDADRAVAFYESSQGWSPAEVRHQILTPVEEGALTALGHPGEMSIMAHQLPAALMKDRQPVLGLSDISSSDFEILGRIYPKQHAPMSECVDAAAPARASTSAIAAAPRRRI